MTRIGDFPIKKRLTWINMLVTGAALLIASAAFMAYELTTLRVAMVRNLSLQAQIAGRNCVSALVFGDPESAANTLAALNAAPNILQAAVYTPSGELFAQYLRAGAGKLPPPPRVPANQAEISRFTGESLGLARPIVFQEKLIGLVYIVSDLQEESQRLRRYAEIVSVVLAISLLSAWLLSSVFQQTTAQPIMELARIARTVSGEKKYSIRATSTGNKDEIGLLIDAFNEMLGNIQDRDAALHKAHERLNLALRSSGAGTWNWSAGDPTVVWDDYMYPLFGMRPEASPRSLVEILNLIHPMDRERARNTVSEAAKAGAGDTQSSYIFEVRVVWPAIGSSGGGSSGGGSSEGGVHWLVVRGTVFRGEAGRPVRMAGVSWDITEIKRVEEDRQKFVSLIEQSADFIAIVGLDGKLAYVNGAGRRLAGLSETDPETAHQTGISLADLCPENWRSKLSADIVPNILRSGSNWVGEAQFLNLTSGKTINILMNLFPVNDPETGNLLCLAAVARDMTERRALEEQLRQAQKLETLGQLAGGVAHDFGTVLTVIGGYAQLIAGEFPPGHHVRDSADEIYSAANRATALTRQLLAFGRRQSSLERDISMNGLIRSIEKMLRRLTGEDADLVLSLDDDAGFFRADRGQIEQAIVNLVINARDALVGRGLVLLETARLYLDAEFAGAHGSMAPGEYVRLSVTDSGTGMTPEVKERIFEPFFTTKDPGKGTGLGLAMVHGIVNQSRAFISVETEPGKGSSFQLFFPAVDADAESLEFEPEISIEAVSGNETILVAEDEEGLRRYVGLLLGKYGYTVLMAANGIEAADIAARRAGPIDLLLTDLVMPKLGGADLAVAFGQLRPEASILFMSGYAHRADMDGRSGANLIQKPFTSAVLLARVRRALDERNGETKRYPDC